MEIMHLAKTRHIKVVQIRCEQCAYEWETTSRMRMVTCPSCRRATPNPIYQETSPEYLSMEHFNLNEDGVRILDPKLHWIVDVYFKPHKAWCSYCESESCNHVKFALGLPEVQKILKEKGWKIAYG